MKNIISVIILLFAILTGYAFGVNKEPASDFVEFSDPFNSFRLSTDCTYRVEEIGGDYFIYIDSQYGRTSIIYEDCVIDGQMIYAEDLMESLKECFR